MEMKRLVVKLDNKTIGEAGEFEGYGSVFGNADSYGDIVAPGAFSKSLAEHNANGTMPALLWQHRSDEPVGVWMEMTEDAKGLKCKGRLLIDDDPLAKRAHAHLKAGSISGLSIGYVPTVWERDEDEGTITLKEIELWEVSLVTFPANDRARVSDVKAIEDISTVKDFERCLRDAGGFSRSQAKALVAKGKAALLREAEDVTSTDVKEIADIVRGYVSITKL